LSSNDEEEQHLRAVALLNAREVLVARQRAEEQLVRAKEALEVKSRELAHSLAVTRATLEATADGIVATDATRAITDYNKTYLEMWGLEPADVQHRSHGEVLQILSSQFADPAGFLDRIEAIYASAEHENFDVLNLLDGRVFERFSKIQFVEGRNVGRVWSFRNITERVRAQESLREKTRVLEMLNRTGATLASQLDVKAIIQGVTDAATQLSGAQFGAFFYNTVNEEGESFTLYTLCGAPREAFERFPLPRATAIFAPTFRGQGVIRSDDVLKHRSYGKSSPYFGMPPGHLPVRSYLAVPVVSRSGAVHGGLFFGHAQPGMFTESHEAIVLGVAAQAAVAIDNAQLLESDRQARRQLQQLNQTLEEKVAERTAALERSEELFQQLVTGITDCAIYMLDPMGKIVSWNPGAERIKGYTAAEVIGRHFSLFYAEEDRAQGVPQQALSTAAARGKYEAEAWRIRKDGTRFWANVLIDPIHGANGALVGFAKITRDMTERRAMQEQLHQSQKMEAIGQLTGGVAHDFNNLLTVILGNLDTIARHIPADEARLRRAADQATRGAQRAATLTQQLLAFSRRQPLNPKPTDVNRLVTGVSELIRRTLNENIAIETVLAGGLWRIEVDAHQLESALLNLAVNSRDAMPAGGKLTIETANAHLDDEYAARFAEISPGQYVVICMSDTGSGMSSEVLRHAFDPFYTTKPIGKGTGLGLSQVFGFVKQSGGHIKLYSEVGEGTTAKIYLPRLSGEAVADEAEESITAARGHRSETILVVEDDDDVRIYSTESLRELGFSVLEACDGPSALRILEHHPEVQLLFTDVGLPGINGRQLVEEARERRPALKVLFTSGYARNAIVHQGRLDQGVELLTKPFTRAQLATRVRDVLDASTRAPLHGERIVLIVEDELAIRLFLAETLEELGFGVVHSASAREALATVDHLSHLEVAFIDIGLPDRSGLELAAELRLRWPGLKIAIASGYDHQAGGRLRTDPGVTFLAKPYNTTSVRAALDTLGLGHLCVSGGLLDRA
jgi:PAS domain S-box-containing protein